MGMDVYGRSPKNDKGEYFRNNIWWWPPLWNYCCELDPSLEKRVPEAFTNDGDGLKTQRACTALAKKLRHSIATGHAEFYVKQFEMEMKDVPMEDCCSCIKLDKPESDCYYCKGSGKMQSLGASYRIDLDNINSFIEFLENCGGFEIW